MLVGILLILTSAVAYNGSAVLLAVAARQHTGNAPLVVAVSKRAQGIVAIFLSILGGVLEIAALALIPMTLARILSVAGLGVLLVMARWALKEPLGRRETSGVGLVALGIVMASFASPRLSAAPPTLEEWVTLLAILGPGAMLPYGLRIFHRKVESSVGAAASGIAYALSGIFSKGVAEGFLSGLALPLALLTTGAIATSLLGFVTELDALKYGRASLVVPIVLALHTVVPIACAPFFFGEAWPAGLLPQALLSGGILVTLLGALVLASSSSHVLSSPTAKA
jgi:hypothetical protein